MLLTSMAFGDLVLDSSTTLPLAHYRYMHIGMIIIIALAPILVLVFNSNMGLRIGDSVDKAESSCVGLVRFYRAAFVSYFYYLRTFLI